MSKAHFRRALELLQDGSAAEAAELLLAARKEDPENTEIQFELSRAYLKQKDWKSSIAILDELVLRFPSNADFVGQRGVTHFSRGDVKSAMADMERAIELEPDYAYRYACRAYVKERTGDLPGAIADYEEAVRLDPEDEVAVNNLEMAREKLQYEQSNAIHRPRTKAHLSPEEIKRYSEEYEKKQSRQKASESEEEVKKIALKTLFGEMKSTLKDKEKRKAFLRFIFNGFKMPPR
jgi:tetratricopeptide (TPR) repeat protein